MDARRTRHARWLVGAIAAGVAVTFAARVLSAPRRVMLMNRIGPSTIELLLANADGSGEREPFTNSDFDYDASFSVDDDGSCSRPNARATVKPTSTACILMERGSSGNTPIAYELNGKQQLVVAAGDTLYEAISPSRFRSRCPRSRERGTS
jgi:hypothetical protein